jgi:hypothetical protein
VFWFWHGGAIVDLWKSWRCGRRRAHELLQEAHMEHVVEAGSWRQLQLIGNIVDDGGDAVRPKEARLELP